MSEEKDIVERLDSFSASWKRDRPSTASLASEASQEIVDLRERVVALGEMVRSAVDGSQPLWSGEVAADKAELQRLRGEVERLSAENTDLKQSVIAFCAPWAVTYARDGGLPDGHLHPGHYDILEKCGARMVDFTRANLQGE